MSTNNIQSRLLFNGGWATDFGPTATVPIGQDGTVQVPYLIDAENCIYGLDGGPLKIGGTEQINSAALNSGASVRGLFDWYKITTSARHRVVHVGDDLMKDDNDGSFTSILGALAARNTSAIPNYSAFDDYLIIMSDLTGEKPLKWTGVGNAALLGTNTPDFAFGIFHKNRFFAAGVPGNMSRAYYSEPLPNGADGDWDAVEAGFFDVDPDDGDEIRGFASHKGILWIFKGPHTGSIHTLKGDTPLGGVTAFAAATQPVPFDLDNFVREVGCAGQNSIFRFRDDIGFIDAKTGSIRSLNATDKFGGFHEAALSFPINDYLLDRVNKVALKGAWAAQDVARGAALIAIPVDSATDNNVVLNMDYRFDPPRWSQWPAIEAKCLASVIDSGRRSRQSIFIGDTDGYVLRTDTANKHVVIVNDDDSVSDASINYKVTLPHLDFGNPVAKKTMARAALGITPSGDYNGTFGWARDNSAQQTQTFSQGGGDVLAGTTNYIPIVSVLSINGGAGTRFSTFPIAHGWSTGDTIEIIGTTSYNGTHVIAFASPAAIRVFDLDLPFVADETGLVHVPSTITYFTLGTSTLSGTRFSDRFMSLEEGGEFRSVQLQVTQSGLNQDMKLHNIFVEFEVGADSTEND